MRLAGLDFRVFPFLFCLMGMSLLVISSMTAGEDGGFWTPFVKSQLRWYLLGWAVFFAFAVFDYRRLRNLSPLLYAAILVLLVGLFFVHPVQNVHRWYKIPGVASIQPSEQAKLVLLFFLSWFLEKKGERVSSVSTALQVGAIVGIPFLLILKQPDLGTALVLLPMAWVIGSVAKMHPAWLKAVLVLTVVCLTAIGAIFLKIVPFEEAKPYLYRVMKPYQVERLNPNTYHQKAATTAIAVGGVAGTGWKRGMFAGRKWLPAAHTDSVFAALGEEFGLLGLGFLLFLFYGLIYCSFQVAAVARDPFGRYLAAGLSAYLAFHVIANAGMMCALLPISGIPLILITYGGSSLVTTMAALGLLQSIYSRRFMF